MKAKKKLQKEVGSSGGFGQKQQLIGVQREQDET